MPWLLLLGLLAGSLLTVAGRAAVGQVRPIQADQAPVQISQIGGAMLSVAQAGDVAYVGQGTRVVTFDLARPATPRPVGRGPILDDIVIDLALVDGQIVALLRHEGLVVLDRSRPDDLQLSGRSGPLPDGHSTYSLAMAGSLALVGDSEGLVVFDLSDPRQPRQRGVLALPACFDVVVFRGQAICTDGGALRVVDIDQPDQPRLVETFPLQGGIHSLAATDALVYVGLGSTVATVDMDQAPDLRIVHQETLPFEAWRLHVQGERLYGGQGRWLAVLGLSVPAAPRLQGTRMEGTNSGAGRPYLGLSAEGGLALLVSPGPALRVMDVSDARAPVQIGSFGGLTTVSFVTLTADRLALIDGADLEVWDVSVPAAPRLLGLTPPGERQAGFGRLDTEGRLVCAPGAADFVQLFDISDPTAPRLVANVEGPGMGGHCLLHGDLALVAGERALVVVDIAQPTAPRILGRLEASFLLANGLDAVGATAFLATSRGLLVIDLSEPRQPRQLAELDLPDLAMAVVVAGHYAHVMQRERGLAVVDVTDAAQPRVVAQLALAGSWNEFLALDGGLAVTASGGRLFVLDLGAPTSPRLLHTLRRPNTQHADLRDGLIASAEHTGGVAFLHFETGPPTAVPPSATPTGPTPGVTPTGPPPPTGRCYLPRLFRRR